MRQSDLQVHQSYPSAVRPCPSSARQLKRKTLSADASAHARWPALSFFPLLLFSSLQTTSIQSTILVLVRDVVHGGRRLTEEVLL
ncbi:hypothetical protein DL95DRAFT_180209 [Leptodontidium sp. 2 PMI_412]|nr:hypothetical protein DL95DRAFT_180209 [Leptodontidium sp. 2 PMI_412]